MSDIADMRYLELQGDSVFIPLNFARIPFSLKQLILGKYSQHTFSAVYYIYYYYFLRSSVSYLLDTRPWRQRCI